MFLRKSVLSFEFTAVSTFRTFFYADNGYMRSYLDLNFSFNLDRQRCSIHVTGCCSVLRMKLQSTPDFVGGVPSTYFSCTSLLVLMSELSLLSRSTTIPLRDLRTTWNRHREKSLLVRFEIQQRTLSRLPSSSSILCFTEKSIFCMFTDLYHALQLRLYILKIYR